MRAISAAAPPETASDVFPEIGDSDFFRLAAGKNLGAVLDVLDELLETLKITNPRAYSSVMRKIQNLGQAYWPALFNMYLTLKCIDKYTLVCYNIYIKQGGKEKMKEIRNIIDAWRVIEKYAVNGWVTKDDSIILVPQSEYERVLNAAKYKEDIVRLLPENGGFCGGRFTIA